MSVQPEQREALTNVFDAITQQMRTIADAVTPLIKQMYDAIYGEYQKAGSPYGESHEGCLRWLGERYEAQRLYDEAERILDHHKGLVYLRKRLAERRHNQKEDDTQVRDE